MTSPRLRGKSGALSTWEIGYQRHSFPSRIACLIGCLLLSFLTNLFPLAASADEPPATVNASTNSAPYPPSKLFTSIEWHWDTLKTAAPGSDLWPITWGADGNLYSAWGDGGGFGGTDKQGRVSAGFARIEAGPEDFRGFNINGGEQPEKSDATGRWMRAYLAAGRGGKSVLGV